MAMGRKAWGDYKTSGLQETLNHRGSLLLDSLPPQQLYK